MMQVVDDVKDLKTSSIIMDVTVIAEYHESIVRFHIFVNLYNL